VLAIRPLLLLSHLEGAGLREGELYEQLSNRYMTVTNNMRKKLQEANRQEVSPIPPLLLLIHVLQLANASRRSARIASDSSECCFSVTSPPCPASFSS